MIIGGALSAPDLGVRTWLTDILTPLFSDMSFPVFMFVIILICAIVTNFFSNMATGIIVSSITMPFIAIFAAKELIPVSLRLQLPTRACVPT